MWNQLTQIDQLDEVAEKSFDRPVFIFKHSTRCGISRMVLKNFEKQYRLTENDVQPYFLDLLNHRDVSNEIATRFGVVHQSPQIVLLKNGECRYTASHGEIDAEELKEKIRS